MLKNKKIRNIIITAFVIIWTVVFHYESLRHFYLQPHFKKQLPKVPFLFPPAGWIMFFNVDDSFGFTEVLGINERGPQLINPHDILATRTIGYDNIQRNVLSNVLSANMQGPFCTFLERKFPEFESFLITAVVYPSLTKHPGKRIQQAYYQCGESLSRKPQQ